MHYPVPEAAQRRAAPAPPAIRVAELVAAARRGRWRAFQAAAVAKSDAVVGRWDRRRRADHAVGHSAEVAELPGAVHPVRVARVAVAPDVVAAEAAVAAPDVAAAEVVAAAPGVVVAEAAAAPDVAAAEVAVAPDAAVVEMAAAAPGVVVAEAAAAPDVAAAEVAVAPDAAVVEVAAVAPDVAVAEVVAAAPGVVVAEAVVAVAFSASPDHFGEPAQQQRSLRATLRGLIRASQPPRSSPPNSAQAQRFACSALCELWI